MGSARGALVVAFATLLAGCAGPGADAPEDASLEDFCTARSWMVAEGVDRIRASGLPLDDGMADLIHDWAGELARVGTPDNMSAEARSGFEKFIARLEGLDAGDVRSGEFNLQEGDLGDDEQVSFARYVVNTCP